MMTIGAGAQEDLESTLFAPLRMSIEAGEWGLVVMLPSQETMARAVTLRDRVSALPVEIQPLPGVGDENDADACFAHFDWMIRDLVQRGAAAESIVCDFTRGTKAMSAALVLAAAANGVASLRYVHGQRDSRGTVMAGREEIGNFSTSRVVARERIRQAGLMLDSLHFMAARALAAGAACEMEAQWLRWLAEFWGAWDRFDYVEARRLRDEMPAGEAPAGVSRWVPTAMQREYVGRLAEAMSGDFAARARRLRHIAADLIENGRRRVRLGQLEDASLRAYRALEMFGQIRLFLKGYDSAGIAVDDIRFQDYLACKRREKQGRFQEPRQNKNGYEVSRLLAASFLKFLRDPKAKPLCNAEKFFGYDPEQRNLSNLIHGFEAKTRTDAADGLLAAYGKLEEFFVREDPGNQEMLRLAKFPFGG